MLSTATGASAAELGAPAAARADIRTETRLILRDIGRVVFLVMLDLSAIGVSVVFAYLVWARGALGQPVQIYTGVAPLLLLLPLLYAAAGLYPGFGLGAVETLRRLSYCTAVGFVAIAASTFVLKLPPTQSRGTFFVAWLTSSMLVPFLRFVVLSVGWCRRRWAEPVALAGDRTWLNEISRSLHDAESVGFRPVAVLSTNSPFQPVTDLPTLDDENAEAFLARRAIRTVIVADSEEHLLRVARFQRHMRHVIVVRTHSEMAVDGTRAVNLGGVLGVEYRNNLLRLENRIVKRLIDVAMGSVLLAAAAPLILVLAAFVRLCSRGPAFFAHERVGHRGQPFKMWKLRTMHVDAEKRLEEVLKADPARRDEWERHMKLRFDPRLIPGGSLLRRFSLDELPQLWSVITGKMSLVGPRPFPSYHLSRFEPEFRRLRYCVRPGLTGMWQVMARSEAALDDQQTFDTYYIRNWSVWLDIHLLTKTLLVVLRGRGAY